MRKSQIRVLKKTIKQWKIIHRLAKEDKIKHIAEGKTKALEEMGVMIYVRYKCFLCHEFHDSINRTCHGCPMVGQWPNKNKNKPPVKQCFHPESLYDDIELRLSVKPKKVKRILRAMKKRLKELENE